MILKDSILLETREKLAKLNPWKIDIIKELKTLMQYLLKNLDFIIAGIIASNAAFVYRRKVDLLEKIKCIDKRIAKYTRISLQREDVMINLPNIHVTIPIGRFLIDLSQLTDIIDDIIERNMKTRIGDNIRDYSADFQLEEFNRHVDEVSEIIIKALFTFKPRISITDIIKTLSNYSPFIILFAILNLYSQGLIDIEVIEVDGIAQEIYISRGR